MRKTGISVVGDLPWGTHFCHFYETKEDLLDALLQFFKTGLENNEFCMWVVFDPLDEDEARNALRSAIPEADLSLAAGDIEIVPHLGGYLKDGTFDSQQVISAWEEKLTWALAKGYAGLRVNGNEAWLTENHWKDFADYERKLNEATANRRMIMLCTYPLSLIKAAEIFDVARTHEFAVARRFGKWEVLETPQLRQAKAEIQRLNEELEHRVIERTSELAAINEDLREETSERQHAEDALGVSEERFRRYFELGLIGMAITSPGKGFLEVNDQLCEILGYKRSELLQMSWPEMTHPDDLDEDLANFSRVMAGELDGYSLNKRFLRKDGQVVHATISGKCLRRADGSVAYFVALLQDITERKLAEEWLKRSNEELRALSARVQSVKEEESTRIARAIHDDLGATLTRLKMDISWIGRRLPGSGADAAIPKLQSMSELIDETMQKLRNISTELRPSVLDDYGLSAAIEWQAREFHERTEIDCRVTSLEEDIDVNSETATAVFRILQEILTNVARHANATLVEISLVELGSELVLNISDNGVGIAANSVFDARSLGLLGMRERAAVFSGRVDIIGVEGKGTTVTVSIPQDFDF